MPPVRPSASSLTPGGWIGVGFESGLGYVHERILVWPLGPDTNRHWIVLTSHGDEYV